MKPDWDKLMEEYADSKTALIADVDCTTEGKPLCEANGIRGYPTLKWGDPAALEDYKGGRDIASLKKFAEESLKPICSPSNIDLCDEEKKTEIKAFMALSDSDLESKIKEKEDEMEKAEEEFKTFVESLQSQYQEAMKKKDDVMDEIKNSGLGLMKAVKVSKKKGSDEL
jgi:hypothetical protein